MVYTGMNSTTWIVLVIALFIIGIVIGGAIIYFIPVLKKKRAEKNAKTIISDAEIKAEHIIKNAQLDAKQLVFEMKQDADKNIKERKAEVVSQENKLLQREQSMNTRDAQLIKKENILDQLKFLFVQGCFLF